MSLEQMNKPELVKLARELEQELKIVRMEMEDFKKELEETNQQKENSDSMKDLPFTAVTSVQTGRHKSMIVTIRFDMEGNFQLEEGEVKEHYKVQYDVDKFNATNAFKNNKLKKKEKVSEEN